MTTEQLLLPRWKVIADFPGNRGLKLGDIIVPVEVSDPTKTSIYKYNPYRIEPDKYPAIFKKLHWWEDRTLDDMPEYVKRIKSGNVFKVCWINLDYGTVEYFLTDNELIEESLIGFLPA